MSPLFQAGHPPNDARKICFQTVLLLFFIFLSFQSWSQDSVARPKRDTARYERSQKFYDSIYHKFSRNKFTHLIYSLAFIDPRTIVRQDTMQVKKSETPFLQYKGKIIRKITVQVLAPFGTSLYDSMKRVRSGLGKALNNVHINTRNFVIRRNMIFRKGQPLDPDVLADNERILRDLPFIDNARILVSLSDTLADSVDVVIITKDVWSIGFDIPVVTPNKLLFRLYDANLLGLGDMFTLMMTTELDRAPFFRFDGASYTYTNIAGSLINGTVEFNQDNIGNQNILVEFARPFLTNKTKFAGGVGADWMKRVSQVNDTLFITSYFKNENLWLGRSFLLKGRENPSRIVVTEAVYRRKYTSRPEITIDSNRAYYNQLQILTGLSWSQNYYYLTDYVTQMGKTENLPYGHMIQLTFGADITDFYTRFYSGISLSIGHYIQNFGYIQAYLKFGGFFYRSSFEDAVLKLNVQYYTPLLDIRNGRYKIRTYATTDYRYGFNFRSNNGDYYDTNLDFMVNNLANPATFKGVQTFSSRLATLIFTPWYLYGFRFALMGQVFGGLCAKSNQPLINASFFSGLGAGIMIKNDNLVFPTFMIGGYIYPTPPPGSGMFQYVFSSDLHFNLYDFNVSAPHEESLGN